MPRFYALNVDVQRNVTRFAIEFFLQELAEQLHEPDDWQKAAANNAIAAFHRGEHEHALTCIVVGETPPDQRSPLSTFTEEERGLSLARSLATLCLCPFGARIRPFFGSSF